jgi:predicted acetyltransferase
MLGMMYRVIDVERFFEAAPNRNFNRTSLTLGLSIRDSFLPANNGRRVIEFSRGRPIIGKRNAKTDVELSLDIADFSGLIMGACSFHSLWRYGLVKVSDESLVDRIDRLFRVEQAPICVTPF